MLSYLQDFIVHQTKIFYTQLAESNHLNCSLEIHMLVVIMLLHLCHHGNIHNSASTAEILCRHFFLLLLFILWVFVHNIYFKCNVRLFEQGFCQSGYNVLYIVRRRKPFQFTFGYLSVHHHEVTTVVSPWSYSVFIIYWQHLMINCLRVASSSFFVMDCSCPIFFVWWLEIVLPFIIMMWCFKVSCHDLKAHLWFICLFYIKCFEIFLPIMFVYLS